MDVEEFLKHFRRFPHQFIPSLLFIISLSGCGSLALSGATHLSLSRSRESWTSPSAFHVAIRNNVFSADVRACV